MNSKRKGIANTGLPNVGGPITTSSGLVFIGATRDQHFRAFDAKSGKGLWDSRTLLSRNARHISRQRWQVSPWSWASGRPSDAGRGTEFEGNFPQKLVTFSLL